MVTIDGSNHLNYSRDEVFAAGLLTHTWPTDVEGINVAPEQEEITIGSTVFVAIQLFGVLPTSFKAKVEELVVARSIVIRGKSSLARVSLELGLSEDLEKGGTNIAHTIKIGSRGGFIPLPMPESVIRGEIEPKVEEYAGVHCENVKSHIKKQSKGGKSKKRSIAA